MNLTLFTSGSTDEPKSVSHSWNYIKKCCEKSVKEIGLTSEDRILDVFPGNTIAHYTITSYPALLSGAHLHTSIFNPYDYIENFKKIQPTYIALIPRHLDILKKTKGFQNLDMSCVRYMVTGSGPITHDFINSFLDKGVKIVANWYGMTECPPPIMIGYNTPYFTKIDKNVSFADDGECIINGWYTGDIFDVGDKIKFLRRKNQSNGKTWKTDI
jgi:acyl-coenzyme A synthetase/AMP-(fatty) acid ligase